MPTSQQVHRDEARTRTGRTFPPPAAHLRLEIQQARTWNELDALCERLDTAYSVGEIDVEATEELAILIAGRAQSTPQSTFAGRTVRSEELLPGRRRDSRSCACCGEMAWWDKEGRKICGICHPRPGWAVERREKNAA